MVIRSRLSTALVLIAVAVSSLLAGVGPAQAAPAHASTPVAAQDPPDPPAGGSVEGPYGAKTDPAAWEECESDRYFFQAHYPQNDYACFAGDDGQVYLAGWPKKNEETWLSDLSNSALETYHSSLLNGAVVDVWENNGSATQWWLRYRTAAGYYRLINRNSGLCLGVQGGSVASGAQVLQWQCNDNLDQDWNFQYAGGTLGGWPVYYLVNAKSGYCLDVPNGSTANGTRPQQYFCNDTSAQYWH